MILSSPTVQPFTPISTKVIAWTAEAKPCQQVLTDLATALQKQYGIGIAQGAQPIGALVMHSCKAEGPALTVGQILDAVTDGLDTSTVTGKRTPSYTWDLVYDPNWGNASLTSAWFCVTFRNRQRRRRGPRQRLQHRAASHALALLSRSRSLRLFQRARVRVQSTVCLRPLGPY